MPVNSVSVTDLAALSDQELADLMMMAQASESKSPDRDNEDDGHWNSPDAEVIFTAVLREMLRRSPAQAAVNVIFPNGLLIDTRFVE